MWTVQWDVKLLLYPDLFINGHILATVDSFKVFGMLFEIWKKNGLLLLVYLKNWDNSELECINNGLIKGIFTQSLKLI